MKQFLEGLDKARFEEESVFAAEANCARGLVKASRLCEALCKITEDEKR
jgi:hypothetical protein